MFFLSEISQVCSINVSHGNLHDNPDKFKFVYWTFGNGEYNLFMICKNIVIFSSVSVEFSIST